MKRPAWPGMPEGRMDMLADHPSLATIATADLDRARAFYEQTLGFKPTRQSPELGVVVYEAGNGSVLLYASEFASTNKATALSFEVPTEAFDAEITSLRKAGVNFETYDSQIPTGKTAWPGWAASALRGSRIRTGTSSP